MNNSFINATRKKYRFAYKGLISTEDLWDLSQVQLNEVYKNLEAKRKTIDNGGLIETAYTQELKELAEQMEIVKYIFNVKKEEKLAALAAKENAEKKQKILSIIERKENEDMEKLSKEELMKMLEEI